MRSIRKRKARLKGRKRRCSAARRVQPDAIEPFKMLAQFYARRASALHAGESKSNSFRKNLPPGSPDKDGIYHVGGGVTLHAVSEIRSIPQEAQAADIDGVVVAEITVNESGIVTDARVLKSNPVLDEAALKAVREWRYDPTIVEGKAVPVKMTVTVNFSLRRKALVDRSSRRARAVAPPLPRWPAIEFRSRRTASPR